MSLNKYRTFDLTVWIVISVIFEYITLKAATVWFNEPFSVSLMLSLLLIVMMRWGLYAFPQAVVSAIAFVIFLKGSFANAFFYLIGNIGFMLTYLFLNALTKQRVRDSFVLTECYVLIGFILMEIFRGIASIIILKSNAYVIVEFLLTDSLNLVFTMFIVGIARNIKDLFVDQKEYLIQLHKQEENKTKEAGVF